MNVTIQCFAQLARAAGTTDHDLDVRDGATVQEALRALAEATTAEARALLFSEDGELQPTILLFLDEAPVLWSEPAVVREGSAIFVMTPIAGG